MNPIFIVGVPRSGTTLVRSLMQVFDGVYLPPDEFQMLPEILLPHTPPHFLRQTLQKSNFADHMRKRKIWPDTHFIDEICSTGSGPAAFQLLVLKIAELDAQQKPLYWGDKTPENIFHLDAIFSTWPNARIIHVVRDPRSTVLSMKNAWGRNVERGSIIWRDGILSISKHKSGPHAKNIFEITYESLTQAPDVEIAKLSQWLSLPFNLSVLNDFQTEERWSKARQTGIQKRGARWDNKEHIRDVEAIEGICFSAMALTTYDAKYATAQYSPNNFRLKLAKIGDAWRVLRVYAKDRGWLGAVSYKLRQWRFRLR